MARRQSSTGRETSRLTSVSSDQSVFNSEFDSISNPPPYPGRPPSLDMKGLGFAFTSKALPSNQPRSPSISNQPTTPSYPISTISYPDGGSSYIPSSQPSYIVNSGPMLKDHDADYYRASYAQTKSVDTLDGFATSRDLILKSGEPERDTWGHKAEFLLASIGLAVGLGNVWRFPYLCQKNGGGAFLIPYIIFMIIEGIPLFFIEFALGQRFKRSAIGCWKKIHPSLMGIGVACIVVSFMLCIYYVIVIAWCIYYFFISFTSDLPWEKRDCPNFDKFKVLQDNYTTWKGMNQSNTIIYNATMAAKLKVDNFPSCCVKDAPLWYWYTQTLGISKDIATSSGFNGPLAGCLVCAWVVVYFCIIKGVKSSGKVVYFTATFPYIVLIILFFRGVTLDGAGDGLVTFFNPNFSKLSDPQIWMDAAVQMFFTLSLGFGALIAFASYMPIKNNCIRDAYTVVLINCGTSIFAGIVVFSILGYREKLTGIGADEVGSGPGLAFVTFCDAFLLMEVSPLWAILFFFMLILLGIDSEFGTLEASIAPFYDMKWVTMRKEIFSAILAVLMLLIGLCMVASQGYYIFQIFDDFSVSLPVLVIAFFQIVAVSWVYGNDNFANDIKYMTGSRPNPFWLICWKYISPLAILIVVVANIVNTIKNKPTYQAYVGCLQKPFSSLHPGSILSTAKFEYPAWGQFLVAMVIILPIAPIFIFMFIHWPKNFRSKFYERYCTGIADYLPDPSWVDPSRRKTVAEMEMIIRKENMANA